MDAAVVAHDRWNLTLMAINLGTVWATEVSQHISQAAIITFFSIATEDYILEDSGQWAFTQVILEWCLAACDKLQGVCPWSTMACDLYEHVRTFANSIINNSNPRVANAIARSGLINDQDYSFNNWVLTTDQIRQEQNPQYMFTATSAAAASEHVTVLSHTAHNRLENPGPPEDATDRPSISEPSSDGYHAIFRGVPP